MDFEEFWKTGPWLKLGKKHAARHWDATVKTRQDIEDIHTARDRYRDYLTATSWLHPQHGSTWFNNWRDWIDFKVMAKKDGAIASLEQPDDCAGHYCDLCEVPHEFRLEECGPGCGFSREMACPEYMNRRRNVLALPKQQAL